MNDRSVRCHEVNGMIWNGYEVRVSKHKGRSTEYAVDEVGEMVAKGCITCGTIKVLSEYNNCSRKASGKTGKCKECAREYRRRWYGANKEHVKAWNTTEENMLRRKVNSANSIARRRGNTGRIEWSDLKELLNRFNYKCGYCNRPLDSSHGGGFSPDHFIPLSIGGSNLPENIIPTCSYCNSGKKDADPFEWIADYFGHNSTLSPYQVQRRLVDYFLEHYGLDYSERINRKNPPITAGP
jgi:5-methylcytosine-specific restriction endonuclease McrA